LTGDCLVAGFYASRFIEVGRVGGNKSKWLFNPIFHFF